MHHLLKKIMPYLTLSFLLVSASVWAASSSDQPSYLFVQQARVGKLASTSQAGVYTLTVKGVEPYVLYFTDRPARNAGLLSTEKFYAQWQTEMGSNAQNAPNVGLVGVKMHAVDNKGKDNKLALTLSNPVYNAKTKVVTYTAKVLPDNGASSTALPKHLAFAHVVLFFDDGQYCPKCCEGPGCTP